MRFELLGFALCALLLALELRDRFEVASLRLFVESFVYTMVEQSAHVYAIQLYDKEHIRTSLSFCSSSSTRAWNEALGDAVALEAPKSVVLARAVQEPR